MLINSYRFGGSDVDAAAYIAAVEAADGQALEGATRVAITAFVIGCKADGTWAAIKASCILAGARTLAGALVPLVGKAPTNFNFVSGDYNRKTGLAGDGSTKYLSSNRANSADPQNNNHNACWVSTPAAGALMASSLSLDGQNYMDMTTLPQVRFSSRNAKFNSLVSAQPVAGLYGHSRIDSTRASYRCPTGSGLDIYSPQAVDTRVIFLFTRSNNGIDFSASSPARLAFYSIGESLDLALLDARVTTLINAISAAF